MGQSSWNGSDWQVNGQGNEQGTSPDEVRVPFGGVREGLKLGVVGVFCLAVGLAAILVAVFGDNSSTGAAVMGGIVGGFFALMGAFIIVGATAASRTRWLVLDAKGLRWQDRGDRAWATTWADLASVRVTCGYHRTRLGMRRSRVRLVVAPQRPADFPAGRRDLSQLRGRYGAGPDEFGVPLGPVQKKVPVIAEGLRRFAGPVDGGVVDEGRVYGVGYL